VILASDAFNDFNEQLWKYSFATQNKLLLENFAYLFIQCLINACVLRTRCEDCFLSNWLFCLFWWWEEALGFDLRASCLLSSYFYHLTHSTSLFLCDGFFPRGWLQTIILLISASWIARITGLSHLHLAVSSISNKENFLT
jgi:hypothetical protein